MLRRMRPIPSFEALAKEKETALVEKLISSAARGDTVNAAFLAGQIQQLREFPAMYRKAHRPDPDDDGMSE